MNNFDQFLAQISRDHNLLKRRPCDPERTLRGHMVNRIFQVLSSLLPEGSYGPGIGPERSTLVGYEEDLKNPHGIKVVLPSGQVIHITVSVDEP